MRLSFSDNGDAAAAFYSWWVGLDHERGARAALRRCRTANEVAMIPCFHRLIAEVGRAAKVRLEPWQKERLALAAALASHVRQARAVRTLSNEDSVSVGSAPTMVSTREDLAMAMSRSDGDKPAVSQARFRRLLEQTSPEDLFMPLLRVLPLIDRAVSLASLADSVLYWGDDTKKAWAYGYYHNIKSDTNIKGDK